MIFTYNLYTNISLILFSLGLFGIILNRSNILVILLSIELVLLAVNLNFICFSILLDDIIGQVFALFILTVAAGEAAIGLALVIIYFRVRGSLEILTFDLIRG